jgi:hypothetical protein
MSKQSGDLIFVVEEKIGALFVQALLLRAILELKYRIRITLQGSEVTFLHHIYSPGNFSVS